jgi:hypothetical protein
MANNTFTFDDDEQQPDPDDTTPEMTEETEQEEGEGNKRNFTIIFAILGGIILLVLICAAIYAGVYLPKQKEARESANNTATADAAVVERQNIIQQATDLALSATPTAGPITETPLANTITPVIPLKATFTPSPTLEPDKATQQALETQLANTQLTVTNQPPSALTAKALTATQRAKVPNTGFADEVGLPGLFIAAIVLMAVILLSRRLRQTPLKP